MKSSDEKVWPGRNQSIGQVDKRREQKQKKGEGNRGQKVKKMGFTSLASLWVLTFSFTDEIWFLIHQVL